MEFRTIKNAVQTEVIEKKSKFIADLFPVENVGEAEELIKKTKKKYHDARHHCIAYRINVEGQIVEKSSDDGEPSGTAGAPMLNILKKNQLVNVIVIVTRYFGGVLLGTGGLVRAYSESLQKGIEKSQLIYKCLGIEMLVDLEYSDLEGFKYYCKKNNILITSVEYSELVSCKIELESEKREKLVKDFETKTIIFKKLREITKKYIIKSILK